MQKGLKNTSLLFLWMAGLVFLMHGFMPHHHHLDTGYGHNDFIGHVGEQSDRAPVHCHAFNNLAVYKTGDSGNKISRRSLLVAYVTEQTASFSAAVPPTGRAEFIIPEDIVVSDICLNSSPTRGSPFSS